MCPDRKPEPRTLTSERRVTMLDQSIATVSMIDVNGSQTRQVFPQNWFSGISVVSLENSSLWGRRSGLGRRVDLLADKTSIPQSGHQY